MAAAGFDLSVAEGKLKSDNWNNHKLSCVTRLLQYFHRVSAGEHIFHTVGLGGFMLCFLHLNRQS